MPLQKWKLLSKKDASPHAWFPIEMRTYQLPNGKVVDDFSVTTLADVAMILPITTDKKVILVRQYKPGLDEIVIQLPAGRAESHHADITDTALHELAEEVGIVVERSRLQSLGKVHAFSTKASEVVHLFLVENCAITENQRLDDNEMIEVLQVSFVEMDALVLSGEIWDAEAIAAWELAKKRFPNILNP